MRRERQSFGTRVVHLKSHALDQSITELRSFAFFDGRIRST